VVVGGGMVDGMVVGGMLGVGGGMVGVGGGMVGGGVGGGGVGLIRRRKSLNHRRIGLQAFEIRVLWIWAGILCHIGACVCVVREIVCCACVWERESESKSERKSNAEGQVDRQTGL